MRAIRVPLATLLLVSGVASAAPRGPADTFAEGYLTERYLILGRDAK